MRAELKPVDVMRALDEISRNENLKQYSGIPLVAERALALLREYKVKIEVLEEAKNQLEIDICNANMNLEHAQAEIERLTKDFLDYQADVQMEIVYARAEAITEFAERLNKFYANLKGKTIGGSVEYHIDQIAKEMKGDRG